jgi:hypothetical protein
LSSSACFMMLLAASNVLSTTTEITQLLNLAF